MILADCQDPLAHLVKRIILTSSCLTLYALKIVHRDSLEMQVTNALSAAKNVLSVQGLLRTAQNALTQMPSSMLTV